MSKNPLNFVPNENRFSDRQLVEHEKQIIFMGPNSVVKVKANVPKFKFWIED
ncbi:hypothetical protein IRT38_00405 (plasmid) [Acinetobacter sp. SK-43]|uniref:hypothetical protein n=1 Tax=Pseudomonadota TaxID=1224 RepID=UPI00188BF9D7|nr:MULTISPECIES: hypothetical protein [Pseudomonadota]MBF4453875.1 hypothetical protein [Acinetobacter sp. SK-43]